MSRWVENVNAIERSKWIYHFTSAVGILRPSLKMLLVRSIICP